MAVSDPYNDNYVFGPVIGAHTVDKLLYDVVAKWEQTYLQEVARRSEEAPDELGPFRSHRVSHQLEIMPEDQSPALIIANLGLITEPSKMGTFTPGKSYYATYRYSLGCLLSAKGKKINAAPRANKLAKMYALAVQLILIQKRDDTDVLGMLDWVDDGPGPLESEDDRTIAIWHTDFNVAIPNAASWAAGPVDPVVSTDPPDTTPPEWPDVTSTDVEIIKEET